MSVFNEEDRFVKPIEIVKKKPRLEWVDYAKGIAIILVVYRHILIGVQRSGLEVQSWLISANEIVFSFRMPLFFILSGLFVSKSIEKRNSFKIFSKYKFNTIYYPYLIWGSIQITIQMVLSNYTNASRDLSDFGLLLIHPRAIDQMWYLYALFNTSILFFFFHKTLKVGEYGLIIISILFFALSSFVKEYSLFHDAFYFLIFFVIGHLSRNFLLNKSNEDLFYSFKLLLITFPLFWFTQYYWLTHQDMNMFLFAGIAILGSFFVFFISFILSKYKLAPFIKTAGKHSLQIYLMHLLIVSMVRIALAKFVGVNSPIIILSIGWIMGVTIPIVIWKYFKNTWFRFLFSLEK